MKTEEVELLIEMGTVLGLINAEFQSDPTSVACFDLRIVNQVEELLSKYETYLKEHEHD